LSNRVSTPLREYALLAMVSAGAILIHGYHLGVEDQAIYLPGMAKSLNPGLFPADSDLFLPQSRATFMTQLVVASVRLSGVTLDTAVFVWHVLSVFLLLLAVRRFSARCFKTPEAQWGSVALVAALFTMPVAGTSLYIVDQYLHPRTLATALIVLSIVQMLDRRWLKAVLWIALAALLHIQMAFYGVLLGFFLGWKSAAAQQAESDESKPGGSTPGRSPTPAASSVTMSVLFAFPLKGLFQPGSEAWKEAARIHQGHYLLRWEWYEWLGVIAPLALFYWFVSLARKAGLSTVAFVAQRVAAFQIFSIVSALVLTLPPQFERLTPYQPMRAVHVTTLIFVALAGGFAGQYLLQRRVVRWLLLFVPLCGVMFYAQRQQFPASAQVEFPGKVSNNSWVQAFLWARANTPQDAYFALDPMHIERPGEDQHGFRAFAQRSMMADALKDAGVVTIFPGIAQRWLKETHARKNWNNFTQADFLKLRADFNVTWVVLEKPMTVTLPCPYQNEQVAVCRIGN
jgi:hypothetical protein